MFNNNHLFTLIYAHEWMIIFYKQFLIDLLLIKILFEVPEV